MTTKEIYEKCLEIHPYYKGTPYYDEVQELWDMGLITSDERYNQHIDNMTRLYGKIIF